MLSSKQRVKKIERHYGRKTVGPRFVYRLVDRAVRTKKPVSVIRLGDNMAKLLAGRDLNSLHDVSKFIGIRLPPSKRLRRDLHLSVATASVVGLSHFPESIKYLKEYMNRTGWIPHRIADSFINDQMFVKGYLHRLIREHRVALVGRAAPAAAEELRKRGYSVALTIGLNHYDELAGVIKKLRKNRKRYDLVFVGASVPGRILCSKIKGELNASAVEIGHMMDAFSHPQPWSNPDDWMQFKLYWMKKLNRKNGADSESGALSGMVNR